MKDKEEFRRTKKWKKWRFHLRDRKKDELTNKPLRKGFNVHHLDPSNYELLEESRFCCLNVKSHKCIEFLWTYYRKDPDIIKRLEDILSRMKLFEIESLNKGGNE